MADLKEAESTPTTTDVPASGKAPEAKKRTPQPKKAKAHPKRVAAKETVKPVKSTTRAPAPASTARKIYSEQERAGKLREIDKSIRRGESIRNAIKQAGISEQTYYVWKKAAMSAPESDDLKDLIALEEENKRLKKQLEERLRKENAELKKKLGLQ